MVTFLISFLLIGILCEENFLKEENKGKKRELDTGFAPIKIYVDNSHFYNNTNKRIKDLIYKIAVKLKANKDKDELFFKSCVYVDGLFVQVIKCLSDKEYKYDLDSIIEYAKDIFKSL